VALLFRYSLNMNDAAGLIESAIEAFLDNGFRTADLAAGSDDKVLNTEEVGDQILKIIQQNKNELQEQA